MKWLALLLPILSFSSIAEGTTLPGFRTELLGGTAGFLSSLVVDHSGNLYYTTTKGDLFRFENGSSTLVAHVPTAAGGDSGLLGMALIDDQTAVVHYTTPGQTADVISSVDLLSGEETVLHVFLCDLTLPGRGAPAEHHGGNPIVAADGSIFVGIGDYGSGVLATMPEWNAGKIFRLYPDGRVEQFARGFRNPFDMAWDEAKQQLIVTDNGPAIDDEIDLVKAGDDCGWPLTVGNQPPVEGTRAPLYVFPQIVAPTGMTVLNGKNRLLPHGYLFAAFVTKAIYYVDDIEAQPFVEPIALVDHEAGLMIDVVQAPGGEIYFATGNAIFHLVVPLRGDCDGDGTVDAADITALEAELGDGDPHAEVDAQKGEYRGTWGCDVNGDGLIDWRDREALRGMLVRRRGVRVGGFGGRARRFGDDAIAAGKIGMKN